MTTSWIAGVILQITSSALSIIASSTFIFSIISHPDGLKYPYQRITFGISLSDLVQSAGILMGPWLSTKTSIGLWAIGNEASCIFDGFLVTTGALGAPTFSCVLCVYYYCKLYKNMVDETFSQLVEKKIYIFIGIYFLVSQVYSFITGSFNTFVNGSICFYSASPYGCDESSDLICDANEKHSEVLMISTIIVIPTLCLTIMIITLSTLYWKVAVQENLFRSQREEKKSSEPTDNVHQTNEGAKRINFIRKWSQLREYTKNSNRSCASHEKKLQVQRQLREHSSEIRQNLSRLYKRELLSQAFLYTLWFIIIYVPTGIALFTFIISGDNPYLPVVFWVQSVYPLQGITNIYIFLRPAVQVTRSRIPEMTFLSLFGKC